MPGLSCIIGKLYPSCDPCVTLGSSCTVSESGQEDDERDDVADGGENRIKELLQVIWNRGTSTNKVLHSQRTQLKGKSHCTSDLFIFSCFACVELATAFLVLSNQNQSTWGQPYSDTSLYGKCSLLQWAKSALRDDLIRYYHILLSAKYNKFKNLWENMS